MNKVNVWCAEKTDGMIDNIIDNISPDDAVIIVNAVYFKGLWKINLIRLIPRKTNLRRPMALSEM